MRLIYFTFNGSTANSDLFALIVLSENADGDDRVRHQSADGHHLDERGEIKEKGPQRHEDSADPGRHQRRVCPAVDGAEEPENESVLRHGVDGAREREDAAHDGRQQGAQAANPDDVPHPRNTHLRDSHMQQPIVVQQQQKGKR